MAALAKDCEVNNELKARKRELKAAKAAVAEKSKKVNEKLEEQKKTMLEKFWRAHSLDAVRGVEASDDFVKRLRLAISGRTFRDHIQSFKALEKNRGSVSTTLADFIEHNVGAGLKKTTKIRALIQAQASDNNS